MNSTLKSGILNLYVPRTAVAATAAIVAANYEFNKNSPYQKYHCCAVIDLFDITRHSHRCPILLMETIDDMYVDDQRCDFSAVQKELLDQIKDNRGFAYLHGIVEKKISFQKESITRLIVLPKEKQFGHFTNEPVIGDAGLAMLENMYNMLHKMIA